MTPVVEPMRAALMRLLWRSVADMDMHTSCAHDDRLDICEAWRALGFGEHWPGAGAAANRLQEEAATIERFAAKVTIAPGKACWTWTAARNRRRGGVLSYGVFRIRGRRNVLAHRMAWMLARGPIGDDLVVCHSCDNPACVRHDHLFIGTQADNLADMRAKGREGDRSACLPRGERHHKAKLTEAQVVELRAAYEAGVRGKALGERFGITPTHAQRIATGQSWRAA